MGDDDKKIERYVFVWEITSRYGQPVRYCNSIKSPDGKLSDDQKNTAVRAIQNTMKVCYNKVDLTGLAELTVERTTDHYPGFPPTEDKSTLDTELVAMVYKRIGEVVGK